MGNIHPTAIIDPAAELADDVRVDAYAVIRGKISIGAGSVVREHTVIQGTTRIGRHCTLGPGAYIGLNPQHLKFRHSEQDPTWLIIGDEVVVREAATLHRAFNAGEERATRIGNRCFIMCGAHVAHDCVIGHDVTLANAVLLAGHCQIGDGVFLGGGAGLHQFVRVGRLALIGGNEPVTKDVPPFGAVFYRRLKGYNAVGCRRAGMSRETITAIRATYQQLQTSPTTSAALEAIRNEIPDLPEVREIVEFIVESKRGVSSSRDRWRSPGGSGDGENA